MKKKIYKICGVALALVLVFSLLGAFAPAKQVEAEAYTPNRWNKLSTPTGSGRILVEDSNVTDFAVAADGATVYLVNDQGGGDWAVAKSTNGGASFSWLFGTLENLPGPPTGFTAAPKLVAVAPDDPNAVALVEGVGFGADEVWVSSNGGSTWATMGAPGQGVAELISDIAVSQTRTGTILGRDYAVSTYSFAADTFGDIYVVGLTATWASMSAGPDEVLGNDDDLFAAVPGLGTGLRFDFTSLALAPNWTGDRVIIAIGSDNRVGGFVEIEGAATGDTYLIPINAAIVGMPAPGPVSLDAGGGDSPAEVGPWPIMPFGHIPAGRIVYSSVALPSDFDSTSVGGFRAYVGWTSRPTATGVTLCADDAYRVDFNAVRKLEVRPAVPIYSISYWGTIGSGILMVGEQATTGVWSSTDPMSGMPSWGAGSAKAPTGANNCIVALISETEALAGTSGANSAFSKTTDAAGAIPFNGLSFIDETIDFMNDVMPSPDGSTVFLATEDDDVNHSLWRGVGFPAPGGWQRVGFQTAFGTSSLIRLSPDYDTDSTLYWFDADGTRIRRSATSGEIWGTRTAPADVTDAAIEDGSILYVISGSDVYRSINGGWFFGLPTNTGLPPLISIAMAPSYPHAPVAGNLVVGGVEAGTVGLSTNAATSFRPLLSFTATGGMHVLADADYATNDTIYAASTAEEKGIWRYEVGTSTAWEQIQAVDVDAAMTGLAMQGLLYGSWAVAAEEIVPAAVADVFTIIGADGGDNRGKITVTAGSVEADPTGDATVGGVAATVTITPDMGPVDWIIPDEDTIEVTAMAADTTGTWENTYVQSWGYPIAEITPDTDAAVWEGGVRGSGLFILPDAEVEEGEGEGAASGVERALYPTAPAPLWDWTTMGKGAETAVFSAAPSALRASGTGTETVLWAIDRPKALLAYVDTMAKVVPTVSVPSEVACDSASGRNADFTISFNQISNAMAYKIDICLDAKCTERAVRMYPWGAPNPAKPECLVPAGQDYLSAGKTYYVRVCAVDQVPGDAINSYFSEVVKFSIAPGVPVTAPYLGPQPLGPAPGATDVPLSPGFTWAPYAGSTKYEFKLANDAALSDIVAEAKVATTGYKYDGTLANNTTYFWAVRGIEPVASDWSPVASFTTEKKPVPAPAPPAPAPPAEIPPSAITPGVIWAIIVIGAILVIAVIVLIVRTRRIA